MSATLSLTTSRLEIKPFEAKRDTENSIELYGNKNNTTYFDHGAPRSKKEVEELVHKIGTERFSKGDVYGLYSVFEKRNG